MVCNLIGLSAIDQQTFWFGVFTISIGVLLGLIKSLERSEFVRLDLNKKPSEKGERIAPTLKAASKILDYNP